MFNLVDIVCGLKVVAPPGGSSKI